jgi:hypothetical protein
MATPQALAQPTVGLKLRLFESLTRLESNEWGLLTLGSARVSLLHATDSVKVELAADALLGDGIVASVARASVAARFPLFRLTAGKVRLSWGEGAAFNAGDLLFGATSSVGLDLTADAVRDDAAWLAAVYVPLGRFSFAEAVVLPPPLDVGALLADPLAPLPDPASTSAGARFVGRLGGIKVEPAYHYQGAARTHTAALTFQGNLLVDWNLSVRAALPADTPLAADLAESLRISLGLHHVQRLGNRASLSIRLEGLLAPGGAWQEVEPPEVPVHGLLLYPELLLSVDQVLGVSLRSVVSPVDGSALLVPGVSLSVHKGLTFLGMATISLGDETDTYAWQRRGGVSFLLGCSLSA